MVQEPLGMCMHTVGFEDPRVPQHPRQLLVMGDAAKENKAGGQLRSNTAQPVSAHFLFLWRTWFSENSRGSISLAPEGVAKERRVQVPEQGSTRMQTKTMPFLWVRWGWPCSELSGNLGHSWWMVPFCWACKGRQPEKPLSRETVTQAQVTFLPCSLLASPSHPHPRLSISLPPRGFCTLRL